MGIFKFLTRSKTPQASFKKLHQANQKRMMLSGAGTSRLESSWSASPQTADHVITQNLRILVARSREEAINNDYGKKFVSMVKNNVVGPVGLRLRSLPKDRDGNIDEKAQDAIEAAWAMQSRCGNWDVTGTMSRSTFERLWMSGCAIDGEALCIVVTGPDAGPTGFALQLIDTMRLDPSYNIFLADGAFIRNSIEFNSFGRPIAYHIIEESPYQHSGDGSYFSRNYRRIPADRVIHAFIPELVGQRRGIPWMSSALWRMHNLKGFEDAAITNARIGASKMGFFRDPNSDLDSSETEIPMSGDPGTFENIGGLEFVSHNPQFPETSTESFVKMQLRGIASGVGVSYNALASDLTSVNFSSLRDGKNDERDTWKSLQTWMSDSFARKVFELWIERCVLSGEIMINGRSLSLDKINQYKSAEFKGRRWAWVDPQADVAAAKMAIEARLASRTKYIEDWNDGDAFDMFEQIAAEEKEMAALGVQILTTPGAGVIGAESPPLPASATGAVETI
jgi:lambda family phage portal protein